MTDHQKLLMHFEQERIKDERFMKQILKNCSEATMACFDEPYPYIIPVNYGFEWEDTLIFYLHTALDGHKNQLIRKNNKVALNIHQFLDRVGYKKIKGFDHDFRSVTCFGKAEIIRGDQEEEFLHGLSLLNQNNHRPPLIRVAPVWKKKIVLIKVTVDQITGKAQYPLHTMEDVEIPLNCSK
jgi:uncharacterized protein